MEYNLEDIIKKCDVEKLIEGELCYKDNLPYDLSEIDKDNDNFIKMRYLEGLITEEEHTKYNSDEDFYKIYQSYVFNDTDVLSDEFEIKDEDKDNLIISRMLLDSCSEYMERFNKIMFRLYFEMNEERLEGLVQQIYDEYGWAKEYIEKYSDNELGLIFRPNDKNYNEIYGIKEAIEEVEESNEVKTCSNSTFDEYDWIQINFGGK